MWRHNITFLFLSGNLVLGRETVFPREYGPDNGIRSGGTVFPRDSSPGGGGTETIMPMMYGRYSSYDTVAYNYNHSGTYSV